jgi:hypothetical protein
MIKYKWGKKKDTWDAYLDMDDYDELPIFDQLPSQEEISHIVKSLQSDGQAIGSSNNFCYPDPIEGISKYEPTNRPSQEHRDLAHGMATKWHLLTKEQQKNIKSGLDDDFLTVLNAAIWAYESYMNREARAAQIERERLDQQVIDLKNEIAYMKKQKYL